MAHPGTVWLVGMMGAGKSTVGPLLAQRLGLRFADVDAEIERSAGRSVAEIFDVEGEAGFRARERAAVASHAGEPEVVALGGGALVSAEVRAATADAGSLVYLRAAPETLLARLGDCRDRPLLRDLGPEARAARLRALLEARREAYESAALVIDTDGVAPERVAEGLARALGAGGARAQGGAP